MQTQKLSIEIIRILPKAALAQKYNCSVQYVRKILQGSSSCNSPRARAIREDALDILAVLMRETIYGKASCQQWYSSRTDLHIIIMGYPDNTKQYNKIEGVTIINEREI